MSEPNWRLRVSECILCPGDSGTAPPTATPLTSTSVLLVLIGGVVFNLIVSLLLVEEAAAKAAANAERGGDGSCKTGTCVLGGEASQVAMFSELDRLTTGDSGISCA